MQQRSDRLRDQRQSRRLIGSHTVGSLRAKVLSDDIDGYRRFLGLAKGLSMSMGTAMRLHLSLITAAFLAMFSFSRAESLNVGDAAPQITATTEQGTPLNFGEVYSKGYTLVYFYPKANTGGCTAQGCSLRDAYEVLTKKGVTVIGVSTDNAETQKGFKDNNHFPFTLIADTDKKVMRAFGQDGVMYASRQAFLIDRSGKIVWRDLKASTKEQANDVLAALEKLGV